MSNELLRKIPKVDEIVKKISVMVELKDTPIRVITDSARCAAQHFRDKIMAQNTVEGENIQDEVYKYCLELILSSQKPKLRPVINATGVVLHTNLGRAVLSQKAIEAIQNISKGYCNLELNLVNGERGSRYSHLEDLLLKLTGAESCLVVNNNASAVLLALSALAKGKEVIVSRGQLVEIGGAFRVPEVMEQSGAKLVEVGSTNKTHLRDYENAITENTALLLKVHTSNYKIIGFTHQTSGKELVELGRRYNLPVMEDLGSGCFINLENYRIQGEPTINEVLNDGIDVVTFSGDKLLGGPQAGIIVGKKKYIELMRRHPLNRAVRIDKFTIAALEATLREYFDLEQALLNIPTLEMLTRKPETIRIQANKLATKLRKTLKDSAQIQLKEGFSEAGGGSLPAVNLPTVLIFVKPTKHKVTDISKKLRLEEPAILTRVQEDSLILDPRTILNANEINLIVEKLAKLLVEGDK